MQISTKYFRQNKKTRIIFEVNRKSWTNLGGSLFIMAKLTNEQKIEIYNKRKMDKHLTLAGKMFIQSIRTL